MVFLMQLNYLIVEAFRILYRSCFYIEVYALNALFKQINKRVFLAFVRMIIIFILNQEKKSLLLNQQFGCDFVLLNKLI